MALALVLYESESGGNSATSIQSYLFGFHRDHYSGSSLVSRLLFFSCIRSLLSIQTSDVCPDFDEDTAHVDRFASADNVDAFNVLTGIAIAMMIPIAGALLISAIMVLPAAISMRLGQEF